MAVVLAVPAGPQVPDGSALRSVMVLPERGVEPAVRVPERVKDWLAAGAVLEAVIVRVVGVGVADGVGVAVGVAVGVGSTAVTVTVAVRLFAVWFDGLILLNVMMLVPCLVPWKVKTCDPGTPTRLWGLESLINTLSTSDSAVRSNCGSQL